MFDKQHNDDDRGQVGIGTLIVFIAMVLVAAIAAGVLINTAGFLQSSAEETGQQSSDQVTNRLEVVNAVGTQINDDGNGDRIDMIELTVRKAPGAGNIDIGASTIQMVHSSGSYDLIYDGTDDEGVGESGSGEADFADADDFNVSTVQDDDSSITESQVLNDPSDRATIYVNADAVIQDRDPTGNFGGGLSEGDTATIRLNTQSGGTTELRLVVPETLSSDSAVSL
jgi:archaeal flagellin N-terminal-like domain